MNINKLKMKSIGKTAIVMTLALSLAFPAASVFAVEAESGSGSSGSSGGGSSASPRPDDNPSASDLLEGTRVLSPETSGADDNLPRNSGLDSARDILERASGSVSDVSGADSARDMFERDLGFGVLRDDDVVKLQTRLKAEGFFNALATGNFMEMTREAVMEFQRAHGIPATGFVGPMTRNELNRRGGTGSVDDNSNSGVSGGNLNANLAKMISDLMAKVKELQDKLNIMTQAARTEARPANITEAMQRAAGVIITGGVSGPGYPTGPLNMTIPATQLLFDRFGTVSGADIMDRQYEAPVETIPPTLGSFPITINGVANTATSLKVITNLKNKNGVGQHQGSIDIDIDTLPGGHLALSYSGSATAVGSTVTSSGTFKTSKTTGIFAGLVAEGTYNMTIVESGTAVGSPVTISLTTVSR